MGKDENENTTSRGRAIGSLKVQKLTDNDQILSKIFLRRHFLIKNFLIHQI